MIIGKALCVDSDFYRNLNQISTADIHHLNALLSKISINPIIPRARRLRSRPRAVLGEEEVLPGGDHVESGGLGLWEYECKSKL